MRIINPKIINAALGISIVCVSVFVAIIAHADVRGKLDLRTKQIEDMIAEHRAIVYRNHDTLMSNEQKLIKITLDQNKVLDQIVDNAGAIQTLVGTNQEILRDLRSALDGLNRSSPHP